MIKNPQQMLKDLNENMRGGKGTVEVQHIFDKGEYKGNTRLIAKITLNPGCSIGLHKHDNEEEIYYIIKGTAVVDDNGVVRDVTVGDAVITGGGNAHSIENKSDEVVEFVAIILLYTNPD